MCVHVLVCVCAFPLPVIHLTQKSVDLLVRLPSPEVFPEVLHCGDGHNNGQGENGDRWLEGIDNRHKVQCADEHEVNIGNTVQLLKEVLGDEREPCILGSADFVPAVGTPQLRKLLILLEGTHEPPLVVFAVFRRAAYPLQNTTSHRDFTASEALFFLRVCLCARGRSV